MASPIQAILTAFSMAYREKSQKVVALVTSYLADGYSVSDAVDKAMQVAAVSSFLTNAVEDAIRKAAAVGADVQSIPLLPELKEAWAPSGMKLSEKLHGAEKEMRQSIVSTIKAQQKLGTHALQTARALYDGYRAGHVVRQQQLPQYLDVIASFARKSDLTKADQQALQRLVRKAKRQVDRIGANGAPDKSLQTAYRQLLNAVDENNTKAIENAVRTAVEEKSRYVAERIARTEAARAWADGFHARYDVDDDIAAYKWQLSSRHPHYDICDMYAHANLWGLGPGIFPKDKTPTLPVHPHCLCHLSLVYVTELDGKQAKDNIKAGGDRYLKQQSHLKRCQLMGIEGAYAWEKKNADWRQYMRNWLDGFALSRDIPYNKATGIGEWKKDDKGKLIPTITIPLEKRFSVPKNSTPNAVIEYGSHNKRKERQRNMALYDNHGFLTKQFHGGPHGNLKKHPYGKFGEHVHDFPIDENGEINFERKTTREFTKEERRLFDDD